MASCLNLYLLGSPRVELDGQPIVVDTRKAIALLVYLAATGERYRRDVLIDLLWPDADPSHGHADLRRTLSALKTALAGDWLAIDRETVALPHNDRLWSDIDEFHGLLAGRLAHGHSAANVCPDCLPLLAQAAGLHRGDFLSGFGLKDSADFDDWQFAQAEGLRSELCAALDMLVQGHSRRAAYDPAITYARQRLALDRFDEAAYASLMRLYAWSGRRPAALGQYQECVALLREQLGTQPHESLTALYQAIRDGHPPSPPTGQPQPAMNKTPPADSTKTAAPASVLALEEKRMVSVLFVQISAAVPVAAPEDEVALLRRFASATESIVGRYQGAVARTVGATILAVFGLAQSRESDPELALRAALDLRTEAAQQGLSLCVGITTGDVYAQSAAGHERQPTGIVGRAIDLAMRLAGLAQSGQILASESTYRATRRAFRYTPCDTEGMPGAPGPLYQAECLLPQPAKERGIEGLRAELTGRDNELNRLSAALALAGQGHGQLVTMIGEAGVGKSRLVAELKDYAVAGGASVLWLEGRCLELGMAASYTPVLEMLRGYFAWTPQDDDAQRWMSIASCLEILAQQGHLSRHRAAETSSLLGRLLALRTRSGEDGYLRKMSPEEIRYQTFLALCDLFHALARQCPLVLVFEDLHWADSLSLDLVSLLMEGLDELPLLLLCVYRPGQEYESKRLADIGARKCRDCFTELHLRELSRQQSGELVASLLAITNLPANVRSFILNRAEGNPFFIEETVRSLIDLGVIYRESDTWQAREAIESAIVPDSVQSVILGRVDLLGVTAKDVLQTAAVIGPVFRQGVLASAIERETDLALCLSELEDRALIYQARAIPEVEYSFKHVLTQQAVYHNILAAQRQDLHRKVAGAVEALFSDSLNDYCEQLAYHHEESGNVEAAIRYLTAAGEKAKLQFANAAAVAHLTKALGLLKTLPDSPQRARRELDLKIALGIPVAASTGMSSLEMLKVYGRAHELCMQLGDKRHLLPALHGLFRFHHTRGHWLKANEIAKQMLSAAQPAEDPALLLDAYRAMGIASFYTPDLVSSLHHMDQGLALYDRLRYKADYLYALHDPAVSYFSYSAWALWLLGYADQSLERSQRLMALGHNLTNPADLAFSLVQSGILHQWRGEALPGVERGKEALRIATERAYPMWTAFATVVEGAALVQRGEAEQGLVKVRCGLDLFRSIGTVLLRTDFLAWLAEAHGKAGQMAEGLTVLDEAFTIVADGGERTFEAELYRVKGELLLQRADSVEAESCFQHALDVARAQGARSFELRAATSLARLWQKQGKGEEARALLQGVYGWFTEGFDTADLMDAKSLLDELA